VLGGVERRVEIFTYWSLDANLAVTLSALPEFLEGEEYNVHLRNPDGGSIRIYVAYEDGDTPGYLAIDSNTTGPFLDRIIGRVSIEMAKHSETHLHVVDRDV